MPLARNGNTKLYWESTGHGPAVLLIAGQRMTITGWWSTIPVLARGFRVIAFDNRDTGRSDHVAWPYTVPHMADDAAAVLDAAEEGSAHIYGLSLGGMVAQELALRHPDRVRALVLGASSAGGAGAVLPGPMPMTYFARALGAAHANNLPRARSAVDSLGAIAKRLAASGDTYWAEQVAIQELGARAWLDFAEHRESEALAQMREAATREDATEKNAVTPGPLAPARELLGDLLMAVGRQDDAKAEYRAVLQKEPNRRHSMLPAK